MRASDIIRGVLDLIDQIDCVQQQDQPIVQEPPMVGSFKDIFSKLEGSTASVYDNSPEVHIQGVSAVTTDAGLGGLNGPKNPADIRSDSVSMYPNFQAKK
jgi:hypothetical protein